MKKELLYQEIPCMHALPIFLCLFISLSIYISTQNKQVVVIFSYRSVNSLIYFYVYLPISLSTFYLIIYLWIHRSIFPISHLLSFILLLSFSLLAYIFLLFSPPNFFSLCVLMDGHARMRGESSQRIIKSPLLLRKSYNSLWMFCLSSAFIVIRQLFPRHFCFVLSVL